MYYIVVIIVCVLVCRIPELCAHPRCERRQACNYWTNNRASSAVWRNLAKSNQIEQDTPCSSDSHNYCFTCICQLMKKLLDRSCDGYSNSCHGPACQSGNIIQGLCDGDDTLAEAVQSGNSIYNASLAINGNTERGNGSCSKPTALHETSYLKVTLPQQYVMRQVVLHTANNRNNLTGMAAYVLPDSNTVVAPEYFCGQYDGNVTADEIGRTLNITCSSPMKGSVVQIQNNVTDFRVCELTVDGYKYHSCQGNDTGASKWFYGPGCLTDCHCRGPCDDVTGTCLDGKKCEEGYAMSTDGVCGCPAGIYGLNCTMTCSNCTYCHDVTGECMKCEAGYGGRMCTRCSTGTWSEGDQCRNCSSNCTDGCNIIDGTCYGQCRNGSYGKYCDETCKINTWGPGNQSRCIEDCFCFGRCDPTTGRCDENACWPGYRGWSCTDCIEGMWGNACNLTCPTGCQGTCYASSGDCDRECDKGFWGRNCSETSNVLIRRIHATNNLGPALTDDVEVTSSVKSATSQYQPLRTQNSTFIWWTVRWWLRCLMSQMIRTSSSTATLSNTKFRAAEKSTGPLK